MATRAELIENCLEAIGSKIGNEQELKARSEDALRRVYGYDEDSKRKYLSGDSFAEAVRLAELEVRNTLILADDLSAEDLEEVKKFYTSDAGKRWMKHRDVAQVAAREHFHSYMNNVGKTYAYAMWLGFHKTIAAAIASSRADMATADVVKMATIIANGSGVITPLDPAHIKEAEDATTESISTAKEIAGQLASVAQEIIKEEGPNADIDPRRILNRLFGGGGAGADATGSSGSPAPTGDAATKRSNKPDDDNDPMHTWPIATGK